MQQKKFDFWQDHSLHFLEKVVPGQLKQ